MWRHPNEGEIKEAERIWASLRIFELEGPSHSYYRWRNRACLQHQYQAWCLAYSRCSINVCWNADGLIWNRAEGTYVGNLSTKRFSRDHWREKPRAHIHICLSQIPQQQHGVREVGASCELFSAESNSSQGQSLDNSSLGHEDGSQGIPGEGFQQDSGLGGTFHAL